jgi:hypothetical protein
MTQQGASRTGVIPVWKKIAISGAVAAAVLGSGAAALAASGSTTSGTPATTASSAPAAGKHPAARALLRHTVHGQFVTRGKNSSGDFVTHDVIRGSVTAVSPTSITVKAADNTTQTYVVNSSTKVRERTNGKGAASTIGAVHSGDDVAVLGTGTTTLTATGIVDVKK